MSGKRGRGAAGFRSLVGGRRLSCTISGVQVVIAGSEDAPFSADVIVLEEDTWLALSAAADRVVTLEHPVRVMTQVRAAQPRQPGAVVVRPGRPTCLLAIVHDMDREPSWTKEWVEQALGGVLRIAAERHCTSLKLPLLATKHGRLPPLDFAEMVGRALRSTVGSASDAATLQRIWLVREQESGTELLRALKDP